MSVQVRRYVRRKTPDKRTKYIRRAPEQEWPQELRRKTDRGMPIRVVIDEDSIFAYRAEPATVISSRTEGETTRLEVEPELSRYFTEEAVMWIRRRGPDDYHVDFDAGFQRGRIDVGKRELCARSQWPAPGKGYLKWIGLSCTEPVVKKWLEGS